MLCLIQLHKAYVRINIPSIYNRAGAHESIDDNGKQRMDQQYTYPSTITGNKPSIAKIFIC